MTFTTILTADEDCYGIGIGCLINKFAIAEFNSDCEKAVNGSKLATLSTMFQDDTAVAEWLDSFVGQPVTVIDHDRVYASDGTYLGVFYS